MEDDLEQFYTAATKELTAELEAIKENLASGFCVVEPDAPYVYWLGQTKTYKAVLEMLKARYKRVQGDVFQDEEDEKEK